MIALPGKFVGIAGFVVWIASSQFAARHFLIGRYDHGFETRTVNLAPQDALAAARRVMAAQGWRERTDLPASTERLVFAEGAHYLWRSPDTLCISVSEVEGKAGRAAVTIHTDSSFQSAAALRATLYAAISPASR